MLLLEVVRLEVGAHPASLVHPSPYINSLFSGNGSRFAPEANGVIPLNTCRERAGPDKNGISWAALGGGCAVDTLVGAAAAVLRRGGGRL